MLPSAFFARWTTSKLVASLVQTDDVVPRSFALAGGDAPCHLEVHSSKQGAKPPTQHRASHLACISMLLIIKLWVAVVLYDDLHLIPQALRCCFSLLCQSLARKARTLGHT